MEAAGKEVTQAMASQWCWSAISSKEWFGSMNPMCTASSSAGSDRTLTSGRNEASW